jgi:hypothetical protein
MPLSTGVILEGSFKDKPEILKNKNIIEDIINIITNYICTRSKENRHIDIDLVIQEIKNKHPDYLQLCSESPNPDKSCKSEDETVFNRKRIKEIIDNIEGNTLYRRMCKFKYNVLNGLVSVPLSSVLYSLNYYPVNYYTFPSPYITSKTLMNIRNEQLNKMLVGGSKGEYGLGTNTINGQVKSNKFVDFDEFIMQYEDHYSDKNVINVKSCTYSKQSGMKCIEKKIPIQNSESDSESKHNIKEIDVAYKALKRLNRINKLDVALDEIEVLLDYLKYFTVPFKTLKKAEKINN